MTRTHRRGAAVDASVLDTTIAALAKRGFEFSVDDIAASAGVHKTTIYRRWPTKAQLVAAAVQRLAEDTVVVTPSDDPLADLHELAVQVARGLRSPAGRNALRATLAAAGSDPELAETAWTFFAGRYAQAEPILVAAIQDGLVRADIDVTLLWQAIVNPMHMNCVCGHPFTDTQAASLVDLVLAGAR